jgi:hypothetical protein
MYRPMRRYTPMRRSGRSSSGNPLAKLILTALLLGDKKFAKKFRKLVKKFVKRWRT